MQELKQRILSCQSFIDQSGPRVSTHPSPASRLLTDLVVQMKECARKIDVLQEAMMADDITEAKASCFQGFVNARKQELVTHRFCGA